MYKKGIVLLAVCALLTIICVACRIEVAPQVHGPTVHMGQTNFVQSSVNLQKGEMLNLQDDVNSTHIITNGSWVNSVPHPARKPGAPSVMQTYSGAGQSVPVGPFNTAGTFYLYCTVHPGMNLTVIVQ